MMTWKSASNLKKSSGKWGWYFQDTTLSFVSHFHCHSLLYFSTLSYCRYSIKSNATNFLKIKQDSRRRMDRKLLWVNGITLIIYDCKTWVIFYHRYIKVKVVIFYGFISIHCTDGLNHLEKNRDKFLYIIIQKNDHYHYYILIIILNYY